MKTKGNLSSLIGALCILLASMSLTGCMTPLTSAAERGDTNAVKKLLDDGADINQMVGNGGTALAWAAAMGHTDIVKLLLDKGANVNFHKPLIGAAARGQTDTVKLLIEKGADVNATYSEGATALSEAAYYGQANTAKLLLEKGADFDMALARLERGGRNYARGNTRAGIKILETIRAERKAAAQPQPSQGIASQPSPAPDEPLTKKLRELKKLQDDGVLTKEEYESQKRKLLEKGF